MEFYVHNTLQSYAGVEKMSGENSNTGGRAGCSLPVVFLASSGMAYLGMPEIQDSVTRLVAAGGVGLGTSIAGSIGLYLGLYSGAFAGALATGGDEEGAGCGAWLGVLLGLGIAIWQGYDFSKDYMLDYVRKHDRPAHTLEIEMPKSKPGPKY
jgi:hypothetical protein